MANVSISQGTTTVVTVTARGPQGPKGDVGASIFKPTGSFLSTTSNMQVTGSFSATTFIGSGSGLTNIPTSSISNFVTEVSRSVSSFGFDRPFPYLGDAVITGSLTLRPDTIAGTDFFIIRSGSFNALTVTSDGVLKFGEFETLPDAEPGALAYSQANFWVGLE